jgi:hypothetical protein
MFLLFLPFLGFSQKNVFLRLTPVFNSQSFQTQTVYTGNNGQDVFLDHFKYYLADITLVHDGGQELTLDGTVYLIDEANYTIYLGAHPVNNIEQVNFMVGVPKRFNTQELAKVNTLHIFMSL